MDPKKRIEIANQFGLEVGMVDRILVGARPDAWLQLLSELNKMSYNDRTHTRFAETVVYENLSKLVKEIPNELADVILRPKE